MEGEARNPLSGVLYVCGVFENQHSCEMPMMKCCTILNQGNFKRLSLAFDRHTCEV